MLNRSRYFLMALVLGLASCGEKEDLVSRAELERIQSELTTEITTNAEVVTQLEGSIAALQLERAESNLSRQQILASLSKRIEILNEEVLAARKVLLEIEEGQKKLETLSRKIELGLQPPLICANGPWDDWPKQSKKAQDTINKNQAVVSELKEIVEKLDEQKED